ncbi:mechanosensitive ion channel family protein [Carboxylicivirga linearis]|uniref:Mechanosensitive ion channel n=1 Tax=Carboxylicivirga linearis TaxID=1628157 RepID=A0ABS5JVZ0_9BACT|nr:mechanosensitive ion channel [Carboxylicivirga linearis]MBS2098998.1 mechanosensitive ion channel [Carboxylicivirga linearis]
MLDKINQASDKIINKLLDWAETIITMLPNLIVAIVVLVIFFTIAKWVRKLLNKALFKVSSNHSVNSLIATIVFTAITFAGAFVALNVLNLDKTVTSLLAGIGIAGLAIGFAFKDVASNFLSGIYMAVKSPINVGDIIEYNEVYGTVKDIGIRATTITTMQGQDVVFPNRLIVENYYTHFTINGHRRIDLSVGISYGDDLEKAEEVTKEAIREISYLEPGTTVELFYTEFGSSSINFVIQYWVKFARESDYLKAQSQGIKNIKKAYDQNDITITFPIRTLDFGMKGGKSLGEVLSEANTSKE